MTSIPPGNDTKMPNVNIESPILASHNDWERLRSEAIKRTGIPWDGYCQAGYITKDQVDMVSNYKNNGQNCEQYATVLVILLQKALRADTLHITLVLVDDFITPDSEKELATMVENYSPNLSHKAAINVLTNDGSIFQTLFRLLDRPDQFIQVKAAKIVTRLLVDCPSPDLLPDCSPLLSHLVPLLEPSTAPHLQDISLQLLQALLGIAGYREKFHGVPNGIARVISILKKEGNSAQMHYQGLYVLWLLSFSPSICNTIIELGIVPILASLARSSIKEKVVRLSLAILLHLIRLAPEPALSAFIAHRVLLDLQTLKSGRKWSDAELVEDLDGLLLIVGEQVDGVTNWDEYREQLRAGRWEWSPVHLSEGFWKENATRLEENRYELLEVLVKVITNAGSDRLALAVAAFDLGQYAKYAPRSKKLLEETGGKRGVMELMAHEDGDVRYQAVTAVQKIMMNSF